MQSKNNSLIYKELVKNMGQYFFGPNGKVTEKYKFLRDYYENQDLKIGFNYKIMAGTLDYYSLLSAYDSYSQRINSTKEQLLFSSHNLAVAKSGFDIIDQSSLSNNKLFNKRKNFVNLNIKRIKNLYNYHTNESNDTIGINEKKKQIKKIKIKINPGIKIETIDDNKKLKYNQFKNNILKENNTELLESLSMHKSPKKTIVERYSNDLKIKELKQKLKYMYSYNDIPSTSFKKIYSNETNKINILKKRNVENYLKRKIKPILFLNRNSVIDLSFLRKKEIKSDNDRNAKILIRKKNFSNMLFDKSDLTYLSNSKLPSLESITLSKKKEELKNKRRFVVEYN